MDKIGSPQPDEPIFNDDKWTPEAVQARLDEIDRLTDKDLTDKEISRKLQLILDKLGGDAISKPNKLKGE